MSESYDGWRSYLRDREDDPDPVVEPDEMDPEALEKYVESIDPAEDYDERAPFQRISSTDHWPGEFRDYSDVAVLEQETEQDWDEPHYEFVVELPELTDTGALDVHASGNRFELEHDGDRVFEYQTPVKRESDVYSQGRTTTYRADMRPHEAEIEANNGVVTVTVPVDRDFDHGL